MPDNKTVELPGFLTVRELSELLEASPIDVIKELMKNGIIANINQQIDFDTAAIVAEEMGFTAHAFVPEEIEDEEELEALPEWRKVIGDESEDALLPRSPVVTMLGHVDHGKTSLLDAIRNADVQSGEAGGITQHMGAYQVDHDGQIVTFLDTPGHEAFTAMRSRGARATDIAVLVVAADDGVMPQTREALDHARAAKVPIVVALNKIDRNNANPELVKKQLDEVGLTPDEWGGSTMVIPVSAITQEGLDDLLEAIVLISEDTDIRANPDGQVFGTVIEGVINRSRGVLATLLVQNGTLKTGQVVVSGTSCGKIRAMFDYRGTAISEAPPSVPVQIMGLDTVPVAGEPFKVVVNEKTARAIVEERAIAAKQQVKRETFTLDEIFARFQAGEAQTLNLVIKADAQGSLEPIVNSLQALDYGGLKVDILRSDTGNITETDIMLASASDAIVLGFCVEPDPAAKRLAENNDITIRSYNIIYKLIEDVDKALRGMLEPEFEQVTIGKAQVRAVFHIRRAGKIAGCYVTEGEIRRNAKARVLRGDKVLTETAVSSLKRFEQDVPEVRTGFECGVGLEKWDNLKEDDIIEFFVLEQVS
ncbi:MAG: translation initiation factor IF-2 [Chloroflexota bacterium]